MLKPAAAALAFVAPFACIAAPTGTSSEPWKIQVENPVPKRTGNNWGISAGAYFPVDSEIRAKFGDVLPRVGITPVSRKFDKRFDISTDINILFADNDTEHLLLVPVTLGAVIGFGEGNNRGFISANTGPAYYDYELSRGLSNFDTTKLGWNVNVEVGLMLGNRLSVTGRYDWYSKSDDFDFSGFSLNLTYALFRW